MNHPDANLVHQIVDIFTGETLSQYNDARIAQIECYGYNTRAGFDRYAVVSRYI
jgi:hypothetical protein